MPDYTADYDVDYQNIVCKNIKHMREDRRLTQQKFAEKADISIRGLSKLERCEGDPLLSTIIKCAKGFGVHPMTFYFYGGVSNALPFNFEYPEEALNEAIVMKRKRSDDKTGRKILYKMTLDASWDAVNGVSEHYGIDAFEMIDGKETCLAKVARISSSNRFVSSLVHKLNLYEVSYLHFFDILEDALTEFEEGIWQDGDSELLLV